MAKVPLNWARSLVDPQTFQDEQRHLAHVWTFLGLTQDVARDGDWFRASIATRSVFVQRFGEELRGFENVCVHRSYPLRNEDRGNGPVICGFHGWQYNRDGLAVGIPLCTELFGKPPHAVAARLQQIELATCGPLIFGRFPAPEANTTLSAFLGEAGPILEAMTRFQGAPGRHRQTIRANWKLNMQISLDDYHSPTIHRTTFGRGGHLRADRVRYFRMGAHSAFLLSGEEDCFDKLLAGSRDGTYRSRHYFVLQILPNLVVAHADADRPFWFINVLQYVPEATDLTVLRGWFFPSPFAANFSWLARYIRPVTDLVRHPIYRRHFQQVVQEDLIVCERIQSVAHQIERPPLLGAFEQRIAWFDQSIRELVEPKKHALDEQPSRA